MKIIANVLTERVNVLAWVSDSLSEILCAVAQERYKILMSETVFDAFAASHTMVMPYLSPG